METGDEYRLTFTTDVDSVDRAFRARAIALRSGRGRVRLGIQLMAAGVGLFVAGFLLDGSAGLNDFVVLGAFLATGVVVTMGRWTSYVRRRAWKRNPAWARQLTCTVSASGLSTQSAGIETRYEWSVIAPVIDLGDMLVLGIAGLPNVHYLPREAMTDDQGWVGLVRLAQSRSAQPASTGSG